MTELKKQLMIQSKKKNSENLQRDLTKLGIRVLQPMAKNKEIRNSSVMGRLSISNRSV